MLGKTRNFRMNPRSHQLYLAYCDLPEAEEQHEHTTEYPDPTRHKRHLVSRYAFGATSESRLAVHSPQAACARGVARQLTNGSNVHQITIRKPNWNQGKYKYPTLVVQEEHRSFDVTYRRSLWLSFDKS